MIDQISYNTKYKIVRKPFFQEKVKEQCVRLIDALCMQKYPFSSVII